MRRAAGGPNRKFNLVSQFARKQSSSANSPPHPDMKRFEIVPRVGVGPITIGMAKAEVHTIFGSPEFEWANRAGYLGGFFINFSDIGQVEFIELAKSDKFVATFLGQDLHRLEAQGAVDFVSAHAAYDEKDPELGYGYVFPELQMSLWRSAMPDDDSEIDGRYFDTVGIGCDGYYSGIK